MKASALFRIVAASAFVLLAGQARAQLTGTLFTQPEEREYLDYLREEFLRTSAEDGFNIEETAIPEIPEGETLAPAGPVEFSFGGIMARRDGSRSVWLNGRLLLESELPEGISVDAGERSASLRIAHEGSIYVLRPGQSVNLTTGTVVENFQRPQPEAPAPEPDSAAVSDTSPAPGTDSETDSEIEAESEPQSSPAEAVAAPAPAADASLSSEPAGSEGDVNTDAITAAVGELDDQEADALFEALQARRLERRQAAGEADEDPAAE